MSGQVNKPQHCIIEESAEPNRLILTWPHRGERSWGSIFFMSFWLCGWAAGEIISATIVLSGNGNLFLIAWMCGWTIAGIFAITTLRRMLQKPQPESISLTKTGFDYEAGRSPVTSAQLTSKDFKSTQVSVLWPKFEGFKLDDEPEPNMLYFDHLGKRVEIGQTLTDEERRWLFSKLTQWSGQDKQPQKDEAAEAYDGLPPAPEGCTIEQLTEGSALKLRWMPASEMGLLGRLFVIAFLGFWLVGWVAGTGAVAFGGGGSIGSRVCPFVFMLIGLAVGGGMFWNLIRPKRRESVTLGDDTFAFQPGHYPDRSQSEDYVSRAAEIPWDQLKPFRLKRDGQQQHLVFEFQDEQYEIGDTLSEPEREWLFTVLKMWHPVTGAAAISEAEQTSDV